MRTFAIVTLIGIACTGCEPRNAQDMSRFQHMETVDLQLDGAIVHAWVAQSESDRLSGLMYVDEQQMTPLPDGRERGMLFVFNYDRGPNDGFWMKNVPIPLDIAFLAADGRIVSIRTMAPFDTRTTHPSGDYRLALETRAGLFRRLGVKEGDTIQIPQGILNNDE